MRNLREETLQELAMHSLDPEDIVFIGDMYTGETATWETFLVLADHEYDEGVRSGLVIVFADGTRLKRGFLSESYAEEWEIIRPFKCPESTGPLVTLFERKT
jgi:hypothetical protein